MACNSPSIVYPNGGEKIIDRQVSIEWHAPNPSNTEDMPSWYEIFFTDSYDANRQVNWFMIAKVPATSSSFSWNIPFTVKGTRCRVSIRCVDHRGFKTERSISSGNFSIQDRKLDAPSILSPNSGESYRFVVPFVIDSSALEGFYSQRSFFEVSYKSDAKGIDWTTIEQNLKIGSPPFNWDIRDLPPSDDYSFKIVLIDNNDNTSVPIYIDNVRLSSLDYFLLDTTPPTGRIKVIKNDEFTNKRDVTVEMSAFDETSGVQSVVLQQREGGEVAKQQPEQPVSNVQTWHLSGDDGIKFIEAIFKDKAGNSPQIITDSIDSFRIFVSNANSEIADIVVVKDGDDWDVYTAFAGSEPSIFLNKKIFSGLGHKPTSLAYFDHSVYVGVRENDYTGKLQKITSSGITTIETFGGENSYITAMVVFDENLYISLKNGKLYQFTGTSLFLQTEFSNSISGLSSNRSLLFIHLENSNDVSIFDGNTFISTGIVNVHK